MNNLQRQLYAEKHYRRIKRFEQNFTRPIYDIIRKPMLDTAEVLRASGIEAAKQRANGIVMINDIGKMIQDIYIRVGLWIAGRTFRQVRASVAENKAGGFGFNEKWTQDILNYFRTFLLTKAVIPISDTTRKDILAILEKGQLEGWSIDKMAYELERVDLPLSRARTILRTEMLKAQFFGTQLGKDDSGFETVDKWIAAHDHRTRHSHREVDGKQIKEGGHFQVPIYKQHAIIGYDMMIGPGDPDASAGNVINCRCTTVTRAARDENGRLIKKSNISVILPDMRPRMPIITI